MSAAELERAVIVARYLRRQAPRAPSSMKRVVCVVVVGCVRIDATVERADAAGINAVLGSLVIEADVVRCAARSEVVPGVDAGDRGTRAHGSAGRCAASRHGRSVLILIRVSHENSRADMIIT